MRASRVWTVDDDGPADFRKISQAIDAANSGDTILVLNGTYIDPLVIRKSISLVGENPFATIIDAQEKFTPVIEVIAVNVVIKGFTVQNAAGVYGFTGGGIELIDSDKCRVEDSILEGNQYGINLRSSFDNTLHNNMVVGNGAGVQLIENSSGNLIEVNWMLNNTWAVTPHIGLEIGSDCNDNIVTGNCFYNNSVHVDSNEGNVFFHNNFMSGAAMEICSRSYSPTPPPNVTLGRDGAGNFWINYSGVDSDANGIGDTPYVIDEDNLDNYPLMKPYKWLLGDVNIDMIVNILDIGTMARSFDSRMSEPRWNSRCDLNNDKIINIIDITVAVSEFGRKISWPLT